MKYFTPKHNRSIYCSIECRKEYRRKQNRENIKNYRDEHQLKNAKPLFKKRTERGNERLGSQKYYVLPKLDEGGNETKEHRDLAQERGYKKPTDEEGNRIPIHNVEEYEKDQNGNRSATFENTRNRDVEKYKKLRKGRVLYPAWEKDLIYEIDRKRKEVKHSLGEKKIDVNELPDAVKMYQEAVKKAEKAGKKKRKRKKYSFLGDS